MATGEGLRQRTNAKRAKRTLERADTPKRSNVSKKKKDKKVYWMIGLIVYFPLLAAFNPSTLHKWMALAFPPRCEGICEVEVASTGGGGSSCSPINTNRLIFLRITKTASTSVLKLFMDQSKGTSGVDLGELEDVVSSIPVPGLQKERLGYHDPLTRFNRFRSFFKSASSAIIYPPFENQNRTFFHGHFHYFDFQKMAPIYYPNTTSSSIFPGWFLDLYSSRYPESPLTISQFTFLRHPHSRVASMYYYDRHSARTTYWRQAFVEKYGNTSLDACLMDDACVSENNLRRWCNLQTELLCGPTDCGAGGDGLDYDEGLEKAKARLLLQNNSNQLFFVGITERMAESLQLLARLVPHYLEDLPEELPRERASPNRPTKLSQASQARLSDLCRFDEALYEYADELLTQRLQECSAH